MAVKLRKSVSYLLLGELSPRNCADIIDLSAKKEIKDVNIVIKSEKYKDAFQDLSGETGFSDGSYVQSPINMCEYTVYGKFGKYNVRLHSETGSEETEHRLKVGALAWAIHNANIIRMYGLKVKINSKPIEEVRFSDL